MTNIRTDLLDIAKDLTAISGSIDTIKVACPQEEFAPIIAMITVLQNHIRSDAVKIQEIADCLKVGVLQ